MPIQPNKYYHYFVQIFVIFVKMVSKLLKMTERKAFNLWYDTHDSKENKEDFSQMIVLLYWIKKSGRLVLW